MRVLDCFVIWAHGFRYLDAIVQEMERHYTILLQRQRRFQDIDRVIHSIYPEEMKTIPHHIKLKNKHLKGYPPEAVLILARRTDTEEEWRCEGHGPYRKVCESLGEHFKQGIRDRYNPRNDDGTRTEEHIIHGTDSYNQVEATLKTFHEPPLYRQLITDCQDWELQRFYQHAAAQKVIAPGHQLPIRQRNLAEICGCLREKGIQFWLQGKTLLGLYRYNRLIAEDHDDDIGVFSTSRIDICEAVYPELIARGFRAIRNDGHFFSLIRDDRYIDICFFSESHGRIGYGAKWFPSKYFAKFDRLQYNGDPYPVPYRTEELLDCMYPPEENRAPGIPKGKNTGKKRLSYEEFLNCFLEAQTSLNWKLRGPHLELVTDGRKKVRIGDMVTHFSDPQTVRALLSRDLVETDTSREFKEPINLCDQFWQSGNNFFFNCIYYGFRKDVVAYSSANHYIHSVGYPRLYTGSYYRDLELMTYEEIREFLEDHPIVVENGCITHGQHRACAMVGMLAAGNSYVPFCLN